MSRFLICLFCLTPLMAQTDPPDLDGLVKSLEQQVDSYARSGGRSPGRQVLLNRIEELDPQLGDRPDYLLLKERIYSYLGDQTAAKAAFEKVDDAHLVHGLHLFNRLQSRITDDVSKCLPMIRRMADAEGDFLARWIHDAYAYGYLPDMAPNYNTPEHQKLLADMGDPAYPKVTAVTAALRAYAKALEVRDNPEALAKIDQAFPSDEGAEAPRYQLFLYRLMNRHEGLRQQANASRDALITALGKRVSGVRPTTRQQQESVMRSRYWLAYACYLKGGEARRDGDLKEAELWYRRAAEMGPPLAYQSMFGAERHFLSGPAEFQTVLARFLESNGNYAKALDAWMPAAVQDPGYRAEVEQLFPKTGVAGDFETLWLKAFEKDLPSAPDFSLKTPDGETSVSLQAYRGKWLMIDFWGTWCGPCRVETPQIEALNKELTAAENPPGAMLTIASRDQPRSVEAYMKRGSYTYDVVMADDAVLRQYAVPHFPYKVMITPGGKYYAMDARTWRQMARERLLGVKASGDEKADTTELENRLKGLAEQQKAGLGATHPQTVQTLTQLANLLRNTEKFQEAETMDRLLLELQLKVNGRESNEAVNARYQLAKSLAGQSKWDEAHAEVDAALNIWRASFGEFHPNTIFLLKGKGDIYERADAYDKAVALYQPAYDHYRAKQGPGHPATLELGLALGRALNKAGKHGEAVKVLTAVREESRRNWGDDHTKTLEATPVLIKALYSMDKEFEASQMAEKYLRLARFAYGPLDARFEEAEALVKRAGGASGGG